MVVLTLLFETNGSGGRKIGERSSRSRIVFERDTHSNISYDITVAVSMDRQAKQALVLV